MNCAFAKLSLDLLDLNVINYYILELVITREKSRLNCIKISFIEYCHLLRTAFKANTAVGADW